MTLTGPLAKTPPKPLVVALHGAVANSATWLPVQRALGDTVDFVAPDLPGHGTRREKPFTLDAALAVIGEALPESTDDRPVVITGDSLGGYLALIAAAGLRGRFDAVVAAGSTFPMDGAAGMLVGVTDLPLRLVGFFGDAALTRAFTAVLRRVTDAETAEAIVARGLRFDARAESIRALSHVDLPATIKAAPGRVYLVNGSLDMPAVWLTRKFASYANDGYAVTIPFATHGCSLTHPQAFADVLRTAIAAATADVARRNFR